jgi:small-conductance mechanosensitive channel
VRAGTGVESLIPNESLVSGVVQNETYSDFTVRHTLGVQISYANDPEQAMALMVAAAQANPAVAKEPVPVAFLLAFADSGINLELQYWIDRMEVSGQQVLSDLNLAVWKAFAAAGISIPFPQREVRIISSDLSN